MPKQDPAMRHTSNRTGEDVFELESKALGDYFRAKGVPDESPENPREWGTLTTMVCFHRRYKLGDEHNYTIDTSWKDLHDAIVANEQPLVIKPVHAYIHGGIVLRTANFADVDPQGWYSGMVGFIYIPRKHIKEVAAYQLKKPALTAYHDSHMFDKGYANQIIEDEIGTYNMYLSGDVWGVIVEDPNGEEVDSLWGLFGHTYAMEMAQEMLKDAVTARDELINFEI
jgi:hypothetical protein